MGHTASLIYDTFVSRRSQGYPASSSFHAHYVFQPDSSQVLQSHHTRVELKSSESTVRAGPHPQTLPVLVSIKSSDDELVEGKMVRYNALDLVCVIDVSGSMSGEKIQLVRDSLLYVLEQLSERDRMALVTFSDDGRVLCELTGDMERLKKEIQGLEAKGSTNMRGGLKLAYNMVRKNDSKNVKSLWVLSDGCDTTGFKGAELAKEHLQDQLGDRDRYSFTIHTLGYGRDHDAKLMKSLAEMKSGKFMYIEQKEQLDRAIANLLGGMYASIAHRVTVRIKSNGHGPLEGAKIIKSFNSSVRYDPKKDEWTILVEQYRAGSTNSYVFEVELPPSRPLPDDQYRIAHTLLSCSTTFLSLNNSSTTTESSLQLTVLHPDDILRKQHPDSEVMENYYRVKIVQMLRESTVFMERRQMKEAEEVLRRAMAEVERAPPSDKINQLKGDINRMLEKMEKKDFTTAYQFTMGQERYHGECYYSTGQERFQSLRVHRDIAMPGMQEFKDREWYQ